MFKYTVTTNYYDGDTWDHGTFASLLKARRVAYAAALEANLSIVVNVTVTDEGGTNLYVFHPSLMR